METYRWDEDSYAAVAAAGLAWQNVVFVLYDSRPRIRRHIGAVLHVSAPAPDGQWMLVTLIEETDDAYLVVGARHLDEIEADAARKIIEGGM